jgi:oxygen-independent coproporphyrinogen-3 oxidase
MPRPYGIYVHYPYCTHRCPYCDFAVTTEAPPRDRRYTRAVLAELAMRSAAFQGLSAASLYLGGGTPSLWAADEIAEVVAAVRRLGLPASAEVTLEVNPESCDPDRLAAWRAAGVNRVSIGVQTFDPAVLVKLGRRHGPGEAERAVREAAAAFRNVSVDLIFGARRSTVEGARRDAARAAALGASHVSAYALTLDAGVLAEETPLARLRRQGRLPLPSDEETLAQGRAIRAALRRAGLRRYEISNFARRGLESVHNGLYWSGASYLGVGAGAWGCLRAGAPFAAGSSAGAGGSAAGGAAGVGRSAAGAAGAMAGAAAGTLRWGNERDARRWMEAVESGRLPTAEEDAIGAVAERNELLMLALRTRAGTPLEGLSERQEAEVERLVRARLAVRRGGRTIGGARARLVLTARGMDLHSSIAERLFE